MLGLARLGRSRPAIAAAVAIAAAMMLGSGAARVSDLATGFASPTDSYKPKIRWWWTCGEITPEEIDQELREIAAAGFGGVEIACLIAPVARTLGWGTPIMQDRMEAALESGRRHGLEVDFTLGPAWPLVVPGLTPDDAAAAQELARGVAVVPGGSSYAGPVPLPEPAAAPRVTKQKLIAVQAARCESACEGDEPIQLVPGSAIDLTEQASGGVLDWTAPAGGDWVLFGFWQRGTGQASVVGAAVTEPRAYVVDHFGAAGARAAVDFWATAILSPKMRALLRRVGGDLFEDSIELDSNMHWTWDFLEEFERRRGYSLRPFLPVLLIEGLHEQYSAVSIEAPASFSFSVPADRRVRHDYYQTLTDLYVERHAAVLQEFAHDLGLRYRAQPYSDTIDVAQIASTLDVPETEGLVTGLGVPALDRLQFYRTMSSSAHMAGVQTYSTECCAVLNGAYGQTWEDLLARINASFMGGVNQVVVHGFSYAHGLDASWPGFSIFTLVNGNGFSEAWGPRQPTWDDVPRITRWLSRMQFVLRQGRPRVDVAIYRHSLDRVQRGLFTDPALSRAGFSFEYLAPAQLELDSAIVRLERLAPDGPAYRALVLNEQGTLPLEAATRILSYARSGLAIVVVGALPDRAPGAFAAAADDAAVVSVVGELLGEPSVRRVETQAEVPSALAELGVEPAVEPDEPTDLLSAHRSTPEAELYLVHNPSAVRIDSTLGLEGEGHSYRLDPWTGEIRSISTDRRRGGRTYVPVSVAPGEAMVLAVGELDGVSPLPLPRKLVHGSLTTAIGEKSGDIRSGDASTAAASPSASGSMPARRTLRSWSLEVSDWQRGPDGELAVLEHTVELSELEPWSQIPGLEDVSGIGTYVSSVELPRPWVPGRDRACLELGEVFDTFRVRVNGTDVGPIDQTTATVDVSRYVKAGKNIVEVRVATTLRNRLRVTPGFPGQAEQARQDYGLIGPVTLQVQSRGAPEEGRCR